MWTQLLSYPVPFSFADSEQGWKPNIHFPSLPHSWEWSYDQIPKYVDRCQRDILHFWLKINKRNSCSWFYPSLSLLLALKTDIMPGAGAALFWPWGNKQLEKAEGTQEYCPWHCWRAKPKSGAAYFQASSSVREIMPCLLRPLWVRL